MGRAFSFSPNNDNIPMSNAKSESQCGFSFIIPVYNRPDEVEELLESQIDQYEDLILRLSRSAPAQSCPELSPATLCMIIRKNRAERNR